MSALKLLLTGATGYIGGSVLTTLLNSQDPFVKALEISALVRGEDKAKVLKVLGINPIQFNSLDESDFLTKAASEHDIVVHTASGFHTESARALVRGLGQRKKATGQEVHYFHTTGTSNIGDKPISKDYYEPRILSDKDDIYSYMKAREDREVYIQRTTDIVAIETGLAEHVKTYLIMSPTIYGIGTGLFNKKSIQIPNIIRNAMKAGHVEVIGDGTGAWDAVHIEDLAPLYELLLARVLNGDNIPFGKQGIFFSETGDYTWMQLTQGIANEMHKQGLLKTAEVTHLGLQEAKDRWGNGSAQHAELGFASNSRSRADLTRELGWAPKRSRYHFAKSFEEEVQVIAAESKV